MQTFNTSNTQFSFFGEIYLFGKKTPLTLVIVIFLLVLCRKLNNVQLNVFISFQKTENSIVRVFPWGWLYEGRKCYPLDSDFFNRFIGRWSV